MTPLVWPPSIVCVYETLCALENHLFTLDKLAKLFAGRLCAAVFLSILFCSWHCAVIVPIVFLIRIQCVEYILFSPIRLDALFSIYFLVHCIEMGEKCGHKKSQCLRHSTVHVRLTSNRFSILKTLPFFRALHWHTLKCDKSRGKK